MTEEPEKKWLTLAKAAAGNGSTEERLIRLMVWVCAKTWSDQKHTRVYDPVALLNDGRAWCDQQVLVFMWLAWKLLGLEVRQIALRHSDKQNGHTVGEVLYDGAWHLYDVSTDHQAIYRHPEDNHILSYEELVANNAPVIAEGHWWKGNNGVGKVGFYYKGSLEMSIPRTAILGA